MADKNQQIEIRVLDAQGHLSARMGCKNYSGQLLELALNHQQNLVLTLTDDDNNTFSCSGRVFGLEAGHIEIYPGLRFSLRQVTRSGANLAAPKSEVPPPVSSRVGAFHPVDGALNSKGADDDSEHSGIYGSLRGMCVAELVQTMQLGRKSVQLDVLPRDEAPGVLVLDDGHLVHASVGDLRGEEAFFVLADARRGRFSMRFGSTDLPANLERPIAWLLLEAARRSDERSAAQPDGRQPTGGQRDPAQVANDDQPRRAPSTFEGNTEIVRRGRAKRANSPASRPAQTPRRDKHNSAEEAEPHAPRRRRRQAEVDTDVISRDHKLSYAPPPLTSELAWSATAASATGSAFGSFFDDESLTDVDTNLPAFTSLQVALAHVADSSIVHISGANHSLTHDGGWSDSSSGASTPNG